MVYGTPAIVLALSGPVRMQAGLNRQDGGTATPSVDALIRDETHESRVFAETRYYRIFLPPDYSTSDKRFPLIYWFHGSGERYNQTPEGAAFNCDQGAEYNGDTIARFVGSHQVIVVKWDGHDPRKEGGRGSAFYNISPVGTDRQFPLYFPEFVAHIDGHYRTIPDREHRAVAVLSRGGLDRPEARPPRNSNHV